MKEIRADEDAGPHNTKKARPDPETHITEAAKLNHIVLQKIQKAYTINPEDDLLAKFPSGYSTRLARRRKQDEGKHASYILSKSSLTNVDVKNTLRTDDSTVPVAPNGTSGEMSAMDDKDGGTGGIPLEQGSKADTIAASLGSSSASTAAVVFLLAKVVQRLLRAQTHEMRAESSSLWTKLYETIDAGEVIWQNELSRRVAIVKCDSDIVVRMIPNFEDFTEYTTLQHIRWHAPDIPVPEPLGAMRSEKTAYIFMAFIRGPTLENVWSQLANEQKVSLSNQLSGILIQLRTMQLPKVGLLGGMGGEGCKDTRRQTRNRSCPSQTSRTSSFLILTSAVPFTSSFCVACHETKRRRLCSLVGICGPLISWCQLIGKAITALPESLTGR